MDVIAHISKRAQLSIVGLLILVMMVFFLGVLTPTINNIAQTAASNVTAGGGENSGATSTLIQLVPFFLWGSVIVTFFVYVQRIG